MEQLVCLRCDYPFLMGTGMLSFGGAPEKLVCLRCGLLQDSHFLKGEDLNAR